MLVRALPDERLALSALVLELLQVLLELLPLEFFLALLFLGLLALLLLLGGLKCLVGSKLHLHRLLLTVADERDIDGVAYGLGTHREK